MITPFKTLADLPDFKPGDIVRALVTGGRGPRGLPGPQDIPIMYLPYRITEIFYTEYGLGCRLEDLNGRALNHRPYQGYVLALEREDGAYPFFMPEASIHAVDAFDDYNPDALSDMWKQWLSSRADRTKQQPVERLDAARASQLVNAVLRRDMTIADFERVTGYGFVVESDEVWDTRHVMVEERLDLRVICVSVARHRQYQEQFEIYEHQQRALREMREKAMELVEDEAFIRELFNPLAHYMK